MISKKTKYALNALTYLARHQQKGPVLISAIAQSERIPQKFLEQIFICFDWKNGYLMKILVVTFCLSILESKKE